MYTPSVKMYSGVAVELADTAEDPNLLEELEDRVVKDVGRTMTEQPPMTSGQVSSGIVDLDCGERPSAEEPKSAGLSAADMLDDRVIPLLRYLDRKMAKYTELAIAGSYVELVRTRTRARVATSVEIAERMASLTF